MIQPEDLALFIVTVKRPVEYIHTMIVSLLASDPLVRRLNRIELVIGGSDSTYIDNYRHHQLFRFHPLSASEQASIQPWSTHRKFCLNYHRCLTNGIGSCKNGILICEDDIIFQDRFLSKLLVTIYEMESQFSIKDYLLACYVPHALHHDPSLKRGKYFASYYAPSFYGTQCMYYPQRVLPRLASLIYDYGVAHYTRPGDMIVKMFGEEINGIYGTVRSLAQHIGRHSTGLGYFHTASSFNEPFPDIGDSG